MSKSIRKEKHWAKKRDNKTLSINKNSFSGQRELKSKIKKIKIKKVENPVYKSISNYKKMNHIETDNEIFLNDKVLMDRLLINYIRHECSNYMDLIKSFTFNNEIERDKFKEIFNDLIKKKYQEYLYNE